ncbi:hypothetical protein PIB30_092019 [Stylosanthes scabra]|uniref:Uncharacterized protein n=1 Tax=Stylosanthes scabra TaxID=79078 RepID=A0ABU6XU31_9FABA|nr:hypothetical protein [Stylosanthes scabra]
MRHTSIQHFQQEGYFPNSSFKWMKTSSIQLDSKSIKGSGRSSPSRFNPLAILWSKNSMLMLGNQTKQKGSPLCADARIPAIPDDTLIPQEPPIVAEAMTRIREVRAKNPRQATPPQQQPPQDQQ